MGRQAGRQAGRMDKQQFCLAVYRPDTNLLNSHDVFQCSEEDPIHLDRVYATQQEALHGLKPEPWDEAEWKTHRERVMQHLIEYRFNGDKALQASLQATYPWPLVAITVDDPLGDSDQFWGYDIHTCQEQNTLGKLLEAYRNTKHTRVGTRFH